MVRIPKKEINKKFFNNLGNALCSLFKPEAWVSGFFQQHGLTGFLNRQFQTLLVAAQEFRKDKCLLRSSALTYSTLLSMVPVLALMFSILKGLGVQNRVEPIILEKVTGPSKEVINSILRYIDNTNVTSLGVFGLLGLVFTVIMLLGNVENSFNEIWRVKKERTYLRKFSDYLSVIIISPIVLLAVMSLTTAFQSQTIIRKFLEIAVINQLFFLLLKFAPLFFIWALFTFIYMFIPNTHVHWFSAFLGSIIGGTLWQLAQRAYINFQFGMAKYNAIYGAMAQLPILLVWLYLSWVIVLFGSQIAFAHQNLKSCIEERKRDYHCYAFKELIGLKIMLTLSEDFYFVRSPRSVECLSRDLNVPIHLGKELIDAFVRGGLISEISNNSAYYQPAKPLEKIFIRDVLNIIKKFPDFQFMPEKKAMGPSPEGILTNVDKAIEETLRDITIKDLIVFERRDLELST